MTEESIIRILSHWVDSDKFPFQLARSFVYGHECDYWAMTAHGKTREFEIKISRSDYFVDAKKKKHETCNDANYFYYVVPKGLIAPHEVDKKYGLIYVEEKEYGKCMEIVKKPVMLNDKRFENWKALATKFYWKYRNLWKQKFQDKEITRSEYVEGFTLQLLEEDYIVEQESNL